MAVGETPGERPGPARGAEGQTPVTPPTLANTKENWMEEGTDHVICLEKPEECSFTGLALEKACDRLVVVMPSSWFSSVQVLWFHLVEVYLDWVKQGEAGSLLPPQHPGDGLKEGTAAPRACLAFGWTKQARLCRVGIKSRADLGANADCSQTGCLVVGGDRQRMMGVEVSVVVASTWSSSGRSSSGSSPSPMDMVELASLELMRLMAASLRAELRLLEIEVRESDLRSCRRLPKSEPRRNRPFFLPVTTSLSEWKLRTKPPRLPVGMSAGEERSWSTAPLLCSERREARDVRRGERMTVFPLGQVYTPTISKPCDQDPAYSPWPLGPVQMPCPWALPSSHPPQ
ncbi:hypothetical protein EYF80_000870 [Liparis tanakae]|uniref:Uncharacterized protein n=1 Tax=Liparis tanakae TaxID=230148 RepID=A0A4Z2JIA7_9TELE|nr:hypothetical protein EYF80_000870 [Liparis tanakae]